MRFAAAHTGLLACAAGLALATASAQTASSRSLDTAWARIYATDCGSATRHPCPPANRGYENEFNGDPRLLPLLKASLPQRESWWVNGHAGSAPVSSIVQTFIGVPGDLLVDNNRYVTATGCVPHDCGDGGMLWIDTASPHPDLVFIADVSIESVTGGAGVHLWIYTSQPANFEALPPDLLANLQKWHSGLVASVGRMPPPDRKIFAQNVAVATLVQPDGRQHDLSYDMLFYKQNQPQMRSGAKQ